jgi:hypothetical protein
MLRRPPRPSQRTQPSQSRSWLGVGDEAFDVVDRHVEVDRAARPDLAPADPALVPVVGAEVDEPGERLAVGDRGHAATIRPRSARPSRRS